MVMEIERESIKPKQTTRKQKRLKDGGENCPEPKSKKGKRVLNKSDQCLIVQAVQQVAVDELLASVLGEVDDQLHIRTFTCRAALWEKLKVSDLLITLCLSLKQLYNSTYTKCGKGKDKFVKFQLEWYRQCSFMLKESVDTPTGAHCCLLDAIRQWWSFRADNMQQLQCTPFHCNAVIISLQSAAYNYLTSKVAVAAPTVQTSNDSGQGHETPVEPDDVYYRFGGAAIAEMLHNRYKRIHTCPMERRSAIVVEISVVKAMQCTDKTVVPASLQYRDRGYMYFPAQTFIPFVRAVDQQVLQFANKDGMRRLGKHLIEVATEQVRNNLQLKRLYKESLCKKFDTLEGMSTAVDSVYSELVRKLCNTRLAEFVDCFKPMQASSGGSATLCGVNLRDTLLSDHVNLKTKFN